LAYVHILSQTSALYHRQHHRKLTTTTIAATSMTKIKLNYANISIILIEIKTKETLEAANDYLSATTTLVMITMIYFFVSTGTCDFDI
jgi:hypothetical protein